MSVESDLFAAATESLEPLAARMRPPVTRRSRRDKPICWVRASRCAALSSQNTLHSFILWGPPGVGKNHPGAVGVGS